MEEKFRKFIEIAKTIDFNKTDKANLRGFLKNEIEKTPVREAGVAGHMWWSGTIAYLQTSNFKPMPIAILIAFLISGSTSFAAEHTVPGDTLYPVKINVNENARGWVLLSSKAKADWDVRRAERRLEEAEKLAAEGRLSAEVRARIEANFDEHANRVEERMEKFESRDKAEVAGRFETSLNAHARILESLGINVGGDTDVEVKKLLIKLKKEHENSQENRVEAETKVRTDVSVEAKTSAERMMKATKDKIEEVRRFLAENGTLLSAEVKARVEAHLVAAGNVFAEGQAKLEAKAYGEAFILFQRVYKMVQEVKLLLQAKNEFDTNASGEVRGGGNTSTSGGSTSIDIDIFGNDNDGDNEDTNDGRVDVNINSSQRINSDIKNTVEGSVKTEGSLRTNLEL